jgi:hypothetical protein
MKTQIDFLQYVYFVQCCTTGLIKIGATDDVLVRLKQLRASNSAPLRRLKICDQSCIMYNCAGDYLGPNERRIHAKFSHLRHHGEWFRPEAELLKFIDEQESSMGFRITGTTLCDFLYQHTYNEGLRKLGMREVVGSIPLPASK